MTTRPLVHTLRPGTPGGRQVLLVHGLEDSWESWTTLAAELPASWCVLAADMPWRAGSDYAWRVRPSGQWLGDIVERMPRPPDLVVAHSFGGHATLEYAATNPQHGIGATALICPLYWSPRLQATWPVFDAARAAFEAHIRDGMLARLGERSQRLPADVLASMVDRALSRIGPMGLLTVFDRLESSRSLALQDVDLPVLVLAAQQDPTLPFRAAEHLERTLPDAQLHVRPEFDHFCHIKFASTVAQHIHDFDEPATVSAVS